MSDGTPQRTAKPSATMSAPLQDEGARLSSAVDSYYASVTELSRMYIPVKLDLIILFKLPDVALFIALPDANGETHYRPFRKRGDYVAQEQLDALSKSGINEVYIERAETAHFTQYVESVLVDLDVASPMVDRKKVSALRTGAITAMDDIFEEPTPERIEKGTKIVSGFVHLLMDDPKAYQLLMSLSSHDTYTLQHSVGVATNAIILAKKIGINDESTLIEIGIGGLLHDIGKVKVGKEIINKQGPLDEREWAEMKKHPLYGYEILKNNANVGMRAKLAVLQHHEDENGTGYPLSLAHGQIDSFAKIVTLADIYNALTTDRSYSKAKSPFDAFALIKAKLFHKVDQKMFESLVLIYGGKF